MKANQIKSLVSLIENFSAPFFLFLAMSIFIHLLGAKLLGEWILINTYISFVALFFAGFTDSSLILNNQFEHFPKPKIFNQLLFIISIISFCIIVLSFIAALAFNFFNFGLSPKLFFVIILLGIFRTIELIIFSYFKNTNFTKVSLLSTFSKSIFYITQIIFLFLFKDVYHCILYSTLINFLWLFISFYKVGLIKNLNFSEWDFFLLKDQVKFNIPFAYQTVIGLIYSQFDTIIVGHFIDAKTLTYYSIGQNLASQIHNILAGAHNWIVPHFSNIKKTPQLLKSEFFKLYYKLSKIVLFGGIILIPIIEFSGPIIFGKDSYLASREFIALFLIYEFILSFTIIPYYFLNGIGANKQNLKIYFPMCLFTLGASIIIHSIFPKGHGLILGRIIISAIFAILYKKASKKELNTLSFLG